MTTTRCSSIARYGPQHPGSCDAHTPCATCSMHVVAGCARCAVDADAAMHSTRYNTHPWATCASTKSVSWTVVALHAQSRLVWEAMAFKIMVGTTHPGYSTDIQACTRVQNCWWRNTPLSRSELARVAP